MIEPSQGNYAIVRVDKHQWPLVVKMIEDQPARLTEFLMNTITIKKVVRSLKRAKAEVERLNKLNGHKGVEYVWQYTRMEELSR